MTNKKEIHAVDLKNKIQEHIVKELQGLSPEQEIQYFKQDPKDKSLRTWWAEVKKCQPRISKKAS